MAVPLTVTFFSDPQPLLSPAASRAADAAALPADFAVVSGALLLSVGGSSAGPLPCDGCVARLTLPISEAARTTTYSYVCAQLVGGQAYLGAAVAPGATRTVAADGGSVLDCSISRAGTFVVGRTLRPASGAEGGAAEVPAEEQARAGKQAREAGGAPAIIGGVVGGVAGAALLAGIGLLLLKQRWVAAAGL